MQTLYRALIVSLALSLILVLAAPAAPVTARQIEPVTYYTDFSNTQGDAELIVDPQNGGDALNLFLGLVEIDPLSGQPVPMLAPSWSVSDDGRVWTFTLRDDVPWVHWDAAAGEAVPVRMVTAHDAAYALQRACDPGMDNWTAFLLARRIQGCDRLLALNPVEVTADDYALVQVRAPDDTTLEIQLEQPAGYLLNLLNLIPLRPVPREVIEEHGVDWTTPETLLTNGPFVLEDYVPGVGWSYLTNPHFPADLRGPGNIERVVLTITDTYQASLDLYDAYQIDTLGAVPSLLPDIMQNDTYAPQLRSGYSPVTMYIGIANDKPPFDNVHVRRAFSAAFHRDEFVAMFRPLQGTPLIHYTPPGVFGAPPPDEVGVGYDPDYAREQLALGGYPNCEGFPDITFLIHEGGAPMGEFMAANFVEELGCAPGFLKIEAVSAAERMERMGPDTPLGFRPHMFSQGWGADFPDADNFLGDMLSCDGINDQRRPCSPIDDLIDQAAAESNPLTRVAMYYEIEERLFGPDGEHPVIPGFTELNFLLVQPWIDGPFEAQLSGWYLRYDWYTIDQEAQLAARGG